ncbi:hypothetical protein K1719_033381 [Acacia pycnantha]|nr:hypothetical protein K1719_033381 [Acacia pycnantha]
MKTSMLGLAKPSVDHACCYVILANSDHNLTLNETKDAVTCRYAKSKLNFANEAQFLLVSEESPTSHPKALRRFLSLILQDGLWNLKWSQLGYSRNVLRKNF